GPQFGFTQAECRLDRVEVLIHVAAKIGGIVGVQGHDEAAVEHAPQWMPAEVVDDAEAQIGERADRQPHAVAAEAGSEGGILERAIAVVDAVDTENVERLPDITRWPLFAGMGDQPQPFPPGAPKDIPELARRMADLGGVEPDPDDPVLVG